MKLALTFLSLLTISATAIADGSHYYNICSIVSIGHRLGGDEVGTLNVVDNGPCPGILGEAGYHFIPRHVFDELANTVATMKTDFELIKTQWNNLPTSTVLPSIVGAVSDSIEKDARFVSREEYNRLEERLKKLEQKLK